ncbi:head GIN domain-containing protein [Pedobacter sp. ASV28]|uniref:head GIN domain-containing protein n=1 Tax=Pedobacter sp. ASV28 TaxID=2795123 RepID=UPI0018EDADBE|nr:head GIN domain-containing protein [Pedobacter sp. ASV28]
MMNKLMVLGLVFIVFLGFSACKKAHLTANGNVVSEIRDVGQFTGLSSSGSTPVYVNYGSEYRVVVKGSSNIVPYFTTRVVDRKLQLIFEQVSVHRDDIQVMITMPTIKDIALSGSGKVEIRGGFPLLPTLNVSVSGSGDVEMQSEAEADEVGIDLSGSGKVDLEKLLIKHAKVDISGSGNTRLQVQDRLKASISGSGKVYYRGNPIVQQDISGSGRIIKF